MNDEEPQNVSATFTEAIVRQTIGMAKLLLFSLLAKIKRGMANVTISLESKNIYQKRSDLVISYLLRPPMCQVHF